ncbi:MAG: hypothetical protein WA885_12865 [Phormidesmis sp.]
MLRPNERAFRAVEKEIDRCCGDEPNEPLRVILLNQLQTIRARQGKSRITRSQIWEALGYVAPELTDSRFSWLGTSLSHSLGYSLGFGAVACMVAAATSVKTLTANATDEPDQATVPTAVVANPHSAFEVAKSFGWRAALSSQNPPHTAQQWGQTATLWRQAIIHLDQVSQQDSNYAEAQAKKRVYQENLRQIETRQLAAQPVVAQDLTANGIVTASNRSPRFATSWADSLTNSLTDFQIDHLKAAKQYGWQAAVASQNAPHPPEKWADILRLWQAALSDLDKIEAGHPSYAEAQPVKVQYQKNLNAIQARHQAEQEAHQRVQSLQATLAEIDKAMMPAATQYQQLDAIVGRLDTIPAGTLAYEQAQALIADTIGQMNAIARNSADTVALSANTSGE